MSNEIMNRTTKRRSNAMGQTADASGTTALISVIIPVYNTESYLRRCLDSVINNTYRNLQIICVDDGSTDQSGAILDSYAKKDPRFVIIHKANGGVSSARNEGLRAAAGDCIAFVDSDDWLHPQYFEILAHVMNAAKSSIAVSKAFQTNDRLDAEEINVEQIKWRSLDAEELLSSRMAKNYVWGKLFRKDVVRGCFFNEQISLSEDTLFNAAVAFRSPGLTAGYTEQPVYYYYDRPGSLMHTAPPEDLASVGKELLSFAQQADAPSLKSVLLKEAMKKLYAARYLLSVTNARKACRKEIRCLLKSCFREAVNSRCLSSADMIKYSVLGGCPQAYRLWRIRDDPTMIDWERKAIAKRKSGREKERG